MAGFFFAFFVSEMISDKRIRVNFKCRNHNTDETGRLWNVFFRSSREGSSFFMTKRRQKSRRHVKSYFPFAKHLFGRVISEASSELPVSLMLRCTSIKI